MTENKNPGQEVSPDRDEGRTRDEERQASCLRNTHREVISQRKSVSDQNKRQGFNLIRSCIGWLMFYIITAIYTARRILRLLGVIL